jgi:hypothetical protein
MAFGPKDHEQAARIGTATPHPIEQVTHGVVRKRMLAADAVEEWVPIASDPSAATGTRGLLFFRTSGGKGQIGVRWKTGPIQILATEP